MIRPSLFIFIFPWDKYKLILKYKAYKQKQSHDMKCVVRSEEGSAPTFVLHRVCWQCGLTTRT